MGPVVRVILSLKGYELLIPSLISLSLEEIQTPDMGLRQGCPLSATLFGLFIDSLHHHLNSALPTAGIGLRGMRLRELVYADDICLLAMSPAELQALIDALAIYFGTLHMEISVAKTKVMSFFAEGAPITAFTCNGLPVEQVDSFKYLGLHFHKSGDIVHPIEPIKHKAAGSWTAVQRRRFLLQCGSTGNVRLQLLQSILGPALHSGCVWGMHSPDAGSAKGARLDSQKVYDFYLRVVCGLSSSTPRSMLLTEMGVLPLQVFWWRQTLRFWNNIATLPDRWAAFSTLSCWTVCMTLFIMVLSISQALWLLACIR